MFVQLRLALPEETEERVMGLLAYRPSPRASQDRDAVVLFWNPECGFCRAMHEDLLVWEATADDGAPRLVVVSSGDAERTREERFRSAVLLDPAFEAGDVFGAGGTPSAIRLDPDGRVASPVVVGAAAVLALMGAPNDGATRKAAGASA